MAPALIQQDNSQLPDEESKKRIRLSDRGSERRIDPKEVKNMIKSKPVNPERSF